MCETSLESCVTRHSGNERLGDFRLASMYDGRVCAVAMGGGAVVAEEAEEYTHRRDVIRQMVIEGTCHNMRLF